MRILVPDFCRLQLIKVEPYTDIGNTSIFVVIPRIVNAQTNPPSANEYTLNQIFNPGWIGITAALQTSGNISSGGVTVTFKILPLTD